MSTPEDPNCADCEINGQVNCPEHGLTKEQVKLMDAMDMELGHNPQKSPISSAVAEVTRERDEARKQSTHQSLELGEALENYEEQVVLLEEERDSLRRELDAARLCFAEASQQAGPTAVHVETLQRELEQTKEKLATCLDTFAKHQRSTIDSRNQHAINFRTADVEVHRLWAELETLKGNPEIHEQLKTAREVRRNQEQQFKARIRELETEFEQEKAKCVALEQGAFHLHDTELVRTLRERLATAERELATMREGGR